MKQSLRPPPNFSPEVTQLEYVVVRIFESSGCRFRPQAYPSESEATPSK